MKEKLNVVKVGGAVVEDEASLSKLISAFGALTTHRILVHGGGRTATDVAARMGVATNMVGGRRITDRDMLDVVTMVYGGLVNKNIVARLAASGITALGLTGADMNVIRSVRRPVRDVDYGYVGDVQEVSASRITQLVRSGVVPVMAPLTHDGYGTMLNTNADTIAAEVAVAMASEYDVTLTYCFELSGVLSDPSDVSSVIPRIDAVSFAQLVSDGVISGGMIPKIENSLAAVRRGVSQVVITSAVVLGLGGGTVIS